MTQEQSERVEEERVEIMELYGKIGDQHKKIAERLIDRAAYLRVTIEALEDDLMENGWTEPFQQSTSVDPYDRRRPNADIYTSLVTQYTRIIKQLDGMLPKADVISKDDDLIEFLGGSQPC